MEHMEIIRKEPSYLESTDSTQLMRRRVEGETCNWRQIQFILCYPRWSSETKALQERGEEEEQLHLGQTLS